MYPFIGYAVNFNLFDDKPVEQYSDTLVNDLMELNQIEVVKEAPIVTNVWITVAHHLYEAVREYQFMYGSSSDFEKEKELDMIYELDLAAANYIGEGQLKGDKNSGYLLYNLAEKIAPEFNQDTGGISQVNKKILDLKNEMTIPLVQKFIWHMFITKDSDFVELYALSILPWIKVYDPSAY